MLSTPVARRIPAGVSPTITIDRTVTRGKLVVMARADGAAIRDGTVRALDVLGA